MVTSTLYGLFLASTRQTMEFIGARPKIALALCSAIMHHSSLEVSGFSVILIITIILLTVRPWAEAVLNLPVVFFSLIFVSRGPNFHSAKLRITQPGMITTRTTML